MKIAKDLRAYISQLEKLDEIVRIKEEVDPRNFELSSIVQHMENGPNKAVLFEKVKGFDIPVVANLFGTIHRNAIALGVKPTEQQIKQYFDDPKGGPGGIAGMSSRKFNAFSMDAISRAELVMIKNLFLDVDKRAYSKEMPYVVGDSPAPCQEVVITEDIDVYNQLPIVWHLKEDASTYITAGGLVQKDPDNGVLNIGIRRHMVCPERYGPKRIGVQIGSQMAGGRILQKWHDRGKACEMAIVLGADPVTSVLSTYSSPHYWVEPPYSEFDMAGVIFGEPFQMVKCKTIDVEVPANAEIIIEGICPPPPDNEIDEGPMMEFTDYAGTIVEPLPYMEITAITHRRNPIYHTCMSGKSEEHRVGCIWSHFGKEQMTLTLVKKQFPHVQDIGIFAGSHGFHAAVSLKKMYEGEDRQLLYYLMATKYFKYITIVDDDIDPHNSEQVEWARAVRAGKSRDDFVIVPQITTWPMDPEIDEHLRTTKLGVLATRDINEHYEVPSPDKEIMKKTKSLFEKYICSVVSQR